MMLQKPDLIWKDGTTPEATAFGDIYFSSEDGAAETAHVFLGGIGAPDVWADRDLYVIGETGFGTGLNFLVTWDLFERTAKAGAQLHYVSVEGFPLEADDLSRALKAFPEFAGKAEELLAVYPPRQAGFHRLTLAGGRVTLTLLYGEVSQILPRADFKADAWFLDGFAPSRNEAMWSDAVFEAVAAQSVSGARLATFTVAGFVRRGLEAAGFEVSKRQGFGRKRDCLAGHLRRTRRGRPAAPWFSKEVPPARPRTVAIIGAGIAGASLAHAFGQQGIDVHVFEQWDGHAQEGSGNPAAMMNPPMSLGTDADAAFRAQAYVHAIGFYDGLEAAGTKVWKTRSGAFQMMTQDKDEAYQARLVEESALPGAWVKAVGAAEASALTGATLATGGLFISEGGFLDPDRLCGELLKDAALHYGAQITGLEHVPAGWRLWSDGALLFTADCVIFANAMGAINYPQSDHFPLVPNRGQLTLVPVGPETEGIKAAIAYGGYISPAFEVEEGLTCHLVGATYDRPDRFDVESATEIRPEDHERNLAALHKALGEDFELGNPGNFRGRAAVRCTTADRLPLVGGVPVKQTYERLYYDVHHGRDKIYFDGDYHNGLYVMAGFGSRGFQYAPLAAEVLTAEILGLPQPVPGAVREAMHPARFIMRNLRRKTWAANGPGSRR
jgi:tRNA 5-methylaminomethyl-2-thiouridine biosynthesis bifunctional protein